MSMITITILAIGLIACVVVVGTLLREGGSGTGRSQRLTCDLCRTIEAMEPTKAARFGTPVRLAGAVMVVPAFLGVLFGLGVAGSSAGTGMTQGIGIGAIAGGVATGLVFAAVSLAAGSLGFLFLDDRKVWKCDSCGRIVERA